MKGYVAYDEIQFELYTYSKLKWKQVVFTIITKQSSFIWNEFRVYFPVNKVCLGVDLSVACGGVDAIVEHSHTWTYNTYNCNWIISSSIKLGLLD